MSDVMKVFLATYLAAGVAFGSADRWARASFCPSAQQWPAWTLAQVVIWPLSGIITGAMLLFDADLKSCDWYVARKGGQS